MVVYVVVLGERYEGSRIVSVHSEKATAVAAALACETCYEGGWVEAVEDDSWENGCDYVLVRTFEVQP